MASTTKQPNKSESSEESMSKLDKIILSEFHRFSECDQKGILNQLGHTKSAPKVYDFTNDKEHRKRIGVISDSHYGEKNHDYRFEKYAFDKFKKSKVDFVIDAGDLLDGVNMFYGQFWEQSASTYEGQLNDFLENRPHLAGVVQYFISGNHMVNGLDKKIGFSSGKDLAGHRDDMIWLADIEADIQLTDKFRIKVMHPTNGSSYSLSYYPQKKIEAMSRESIPQMLIMGHYHKSAYFYFRDVHALLAGTSCNQTSFMRGKGLSADVGAWIIDLYFKSDGTLTRIVPEFIPKSW